MRKTLSVLAVAGVLFAPIAVGGTAMAAPKAGLDSSSGNGGSNGWGNCGHNSSGGKKTRLVLDDDAGNGGFKQGDRCLPEAPPETPDDGLYFDS